MTVTKRLAVIASLVPPGARVCDIGTDHAYLPIYLKKTDRAVRVLAVDVREKPLQTARRNILASGVSGIKTRLCDGLSGVSREEADAVVIAGIGGEVISGIISACTWLCEEPVPTLILQPTTSPEVLRRRLSDSGFSVLTELPVEENGKLYAVMQCVFTGAPASLSEEDCYAGKIDPSDPVGRNYLEKQYRRLKTRADALAKRSEDDAEAVRAGRLAAAFRQRFLSVATPQEDEHGL
ncbi:MAG: SAM-dependent methyltransferase [Clostridia bacterium]|nr:SAM-dependent methyltransferase [Clostridia bacterium]